MHKQFRPRKLLLTALLITFVLITSAGEAQALMIKMELDELTETSDAIAYGTVTGVHSQWDEEQTNISTTVTFSVKKGLKGGRQGETITVIVAGGEVDGIGQYVSDTPRFKSGEEAILFLQELKQEKLPRRQIQPRHFEMSGNFQGKLILPPDNKEKTLQQIEESISVFTAENRTAKDFPATIEKEVVSGDGFVYNGMRWYGTSPVVPYKVNSSYETRIDHIQAAASTWSSAGANFALSYDGIHSRIGRAERNNINEIMWYNLNSDQTLALATVWYSGDRILENDMVFNTMFNWSTDGYPYYDVQTIALHEFGHWLSLGHSPIYESIMYYQNKGIQRTLHSVDISGIRYIYGGAGAEVPVNDNFADRLILETSSGQTTGTNINASTETGEPDHAGTTGGTSVWWEWTPPANGQVEFNTFGSSFDTLLAIYTGSSLTNLQSIASNDDYGGTYQSKVDFNAMAGTAYKIAVDGWRTSTGDIVLSWQFTPDPCSVTAPDQPDGPDSGTAGEQYVYTATGGSCSNGHDLEYRFDLGNSTVTGWDASPSVTASWAKPGIYNMRAQARCSIQTEQESPWSASREVTINDPVYNLTVSIEGEGTTSPEPGTHAYSRGNSVGLNAEPAEGWLFEHWVIDEIIFEDAIQTVVITADMEATACFSEEPPVPEYILTISATGEGTTTPAQGSHSFTEGTTVQLTASPAENWHFEKWIVDGAEFFEPAID
ncbi:MAG: matrixin family metalloprotease, partial [Bacillota bacterium]